MKQARPKRAVAYVAVGAVLFTGLAACSAKPASESPSTSDASTAPATSDASTGNADLAGNLSVSWISGELAGLKAVIAAFEKEHPAVNVTLSAVDTGPYQATLRTQLSAGTASDVVFTWPSDGNAAAIRQLGGAEYLEDLSGRPWVSDWGPYIKGLMSIDGAVLAMAPALGAFVPIYNQGALDAAGLAAPATYEELRTFCTAARDKGTYALALPGGELYGAMGIFYNLVVPFVYADGTQFDQDLLDGKTTFAKSGYADAARLFTELKNSDCFNPNYKGMMWEDAMREVANGSALGLMMGSPRLPIMQDLNPDAELKMYPFDASDGKGNGVVAMSSNGGAAVPKGGANKELALAFVDFLGANTVMYSNAMAGGTIPSVLKGFSPSNDNEAYLASTLESGHAVHYLNQMWPTGEVEAAMASGVQGILVETETAEGLLQKMQIALDGR